LHTEPPLETLNLLPSAPAEPGGPVLSTDLSTTGLPAGSPDAPAIVRVALERGLREPLDYLPISGREALSLPAGARVRVPIGRRHAVGLIIGHAAHSALAENRLRRISELLDPEPLLDAPLLELLRRTAEYYHHPLGAVLAAALPRLLRGGVHAAATERYLALTPAGLAAVAAGEPRRGPRQRALLDHLAHSMGEASVSGLDEAQPGWRTAARALQKRGWLNLTERAVRGITAPAQSPVAASGPPLTEAQAAAVGAIGAAAHGFSCLVLEGATGSGKTEVYLCATAEALARGECVLVLVPEIGLTPQLIGRFRERFGIPMALLHSGLSDAERLSAWRMARSGAARIVMGTRSAVFAPVQALGLIIIDEEHDASYKQHEGGCRYSARDLAVWRAQQLKVPVVLGSATPALETMHNLASGRYTRLLLPRRADQAAAPRIGLIDLRAHAVHAGIGGPVLQAMGRHLEEGGQVIVYLNRRGYAPTLLCTSCGWIAPCRACDARLTVHRGAGQLRCHYCGAEEALPERCARCGYAVKPVGQGTERVAETLQEMFPAHALVRLDRDVARAHARIEAVMDSVLSGAARILVGTQMVTKGHHFPGVTLVVVLNADHGLFSTDFRAAERLAQTIVQVAGRAGRAERAGEVLIQTEYPEHPLLQQLLAAGYEGFAAGALKERAAAGWPPFARLALLRASGRAPGAALHFLAAARTQAGKPAQVRLLGPVEATMVRRADRYHAQLLIESPERAPLHRFLHGFVAGLDALPEARAVRWALDVDPLDTQ
jgi:primosomal protein N' (replication factor Y) (superfamily II helicase)